MKRIFLLSLVLVLSLCICACQKAKTDISSNVPSINETEQYIPTLTLADRTMAYFEIVYKDSNTPTAITDKDDYEFIKKYTYSETVTGEIEKVLSSFPDISVINFTTVDGISHHYYLLQDGRIVEQEMSGDSTYVQKNFHIFTADKESMLTEEKLIALLKKYDGYK